MAEDIFASWDQVLVAKLILTAIVLVVASVASHLLQLPVKRLLGVDEQRKVGGTIFQNIVRVLVWGWAICVIVDLLFGVDVTAVIGALGVAGIAVSLGAQQTIANVIGGMIVSLSSKLGPGDWVTIQGHNEARFLDTNWRRTTLEDENGIVLAVPNSVMVSSVMEKGHPFYTIVVPFSLKTDVPDIAGLLEECEQVLLDAQVKQGMDYEGMRPKANVEGATLGAIQTEVKLYVNRDYDSRTVKRTVLPALVNLLQERDALASVEVCAA